MRPRNAHALLALNLIYCTAALFEERMPGWKMFESGERLDWTFTDRDGRAVTVEDYLPDGAYLLSYPELAQVAAFVCRREPARAPYVLHEQRHAELVLGPDCAR